MNVRYVSHSSATASHVSMSSNASPCSKFKGGTECTSLTHASNATPSLGSGVGTHRVVRFHSCLSRASRDASARAASLRAWNAADSSRVGASVASSAATRSASSRSNSRSSASRASLASSSRLAFSSALRRFCSSLAAFSAALAAFSSALSFFFLAWGHERGGAAGRPGQRGDVGKEHRDHQIYNGNGKRARARVRRAGVAADEGSGIRGRTMIRPCGLGPGRRRLGSRAAPNRCARPADDAFPNGDSSVVVSVKHAEKNWREVHSRMSALTRVLSGGARALALRGPGRVSPVLTGRRYSSNPAEDFDLMGAGGSSVIDTYTERGFVVGGVEHRGSVFLYQDMTLLWKVKDIAEATPASLTAAHALGPRRTCSSSAAAHHRGASQGDCRVFQRWPREPRWRFWTRQTRWRRTTYWSRRRSVAAAMILPRAEG